MRPVVGLLGQDMAGQILFAQALLDHNERALLGIVQTSAERAVPPFDGGFNGGFGEGFLGCVGVVNDDDVAAFAGQRGAHRGGQPGAAHRVVEAGFCVLVAGQAVSAAPQALIPGRFDQPAALHAIAQ